MPVHQNRSVGRTLTVLELLGNASKALTLTEIARASDLDASTCYRILRVLCERGFVQKADTTRRYALSLNAFRLGSPDRIVQGVSNKARLCLQRLAKELNQTVRMAALEGAEARFCAEGGVNKPMRPMLGAIVDAHASAAGKVLLAWRSRADIELLYRARNMYAYSDRTVRNVPALLTELAKVRAQGWALCDGEGRLNGDRSLAAPCFDGKGQVWFSIAIASTKSHMPPDCDKLFLPKLIATTKEVSEALGLIGPDAVRELFTRPANNSADQHAELTEA
jgi:DNA-binding IclR family transcriptional regulator